MEVQGNLIVPTNFDKDTLLKITSKANDIKKDNELASLIKYIEQKVVNAVNTGVYEITFPSYDEQPVIVYYWTEAVLRERLKTHFKDCDVNVILTPSSTFVKEFGGTLMRIQVAWYR